VELSRGVLVTGADGQLGEALCKEFGGGPCPADAGLVGRHAVARRPIRPMWTWLCTPPTSTDVDGEAIFEEAALDCSVRRGPAYSVLRSDRTDAPKLPHSREGLRACLERL